MRRFYLFVRNKKSGIFYAQIRNPETGRLLTAKSTGTRDCEQAAFIAQKWLYEGLPQSRTKEIRSVQKIFTSDKILNDLKQILFTEDDVSKFIRLFKSRGFLSGGNSSQALVEYLTKFWDYDTSLYVKSKLAHGQRIGRAYVENSLRLVNKYWWPYFQNKTLTAITKIDIEKFSLHLSELDRTDQYGNKSKDKLSAQTINHILKVGSVALRYAKDNGMISINPMENIMKFSGKRKLRGILTDQEVKRLFSVEWIGTHGNKLANLLAMQTGMRLGEIRGLQVKNLRPDRIIVTLSWNNQTGLKSTKTGKPREIPITPEVYDKLMNYAGSSTWGVSPENFVFWSIRTPKEPQGGRTMLRAFNAAMAKIGIDKTEQKARGIVFHSWRHFYSKKMATRLDERAMKLTGHSTLSVFEEYAGHRDEADFSEAAEVTADVFGKILQFDKEAI